MDSCYLGRHLMNPGFKKIKNLFLIYRKFLVHLDF